MKHLNSKILATIVACSAAMLLNVNVHASTTQNQQPATKRPRTFQINKSNQTLKHSQMVMPKNWQGHHYTYQNLRSVKDHQNSVIRLGSRRNRRNNVRTNKRQAKNKRRQNQKARRVNNRRQNRENKQTKSRTRNNKRNRSRQKRNNKKPVKQSNKHNQKQAKQQNKKQRHVKYQSPKLARFHETTVNQKKPAFNHFKKSVSYVNNDKPDNFTSVSDNGGSYGDSDYAREGTPITGTTQNGSPITFHRVTFIPKKMNNKRIMNQFYSPQGLVIAGRYAYVITNATNSYEASHNNDSDSNKQAPQSYINGDKKTGSSPYKLGATQIIRINLGKHVKDYNENLKAAHRNIKIGPVFYGGHGQGFAYNPRTKQLWLLNNKQGQVSKTAVSLINLRTLLPQLRINFHTGNNTTIGDDMTFDKKGNVYNVTEAGPGSFASQGALKFFAGSINRRGIHMKFIKQALQWAPSDVIQGLTYNPKNNRLYILGDDSVISVPANKLGHLQTSDVWCTSFDTTREFEGLSFDNAGNGYLLVNRSPEILRANYDRSLQF